MKKNLRWLINTPGMLQEIGGNPEMSVMRQPLRILASRLGEVAERAIQLNDPALNILMIELALYDLSNNGKKVDTEKQQKLLRQEKRRLRKITQLHGIDSDSIQRQTDNDSNAAPRKS